MERFYSRSSEEAGTGVFLPDSEIEILLRGFGKDFRLLITDIRNEREQEQRLFSAAPSEGGPVWEEISDPFYAEFFRPEVCIENQIYETARTPGVLLRFVDRSVPEIQEKLRERDLLKERVLSLRMELRTLEHELADEQRKETARAVCLERLGAAAGRACALLPGFSEILFSFIEKPDDKKRRASFSSAMEELRVRGFRTEKLEKLLEEHRRLSERASRTEELRASIEKLSSRSRETLQAFGEKRKELTALRNAYVRDVLGEGENIRFEVTPAADPKSLTELMEHASAEEAVILPEDQLHAFFRPNGAKKFFPMTAASSGERAVAVLTFLLAQGSVPLIMDQPEDDLDNRLVYELVVRDLKKIKETRQLILVTHNANIPVNADAELIISMDPWAKYTKVRMSGTMDEEDIRHEICDVLEGTDEAFSRRARKYHL